MEDQTSVVGELDELSFVWTIKDLDIQGKTSSNAVYSPQFIIQNCEKKWRLYFYFHKEKDSIDEDLSIYLRNESKSSMKIDLVRISIFNLKNDHVKTRDFEEQNFPQPIGFGFRSFLKKKILCSSDCLNANNKLSMKVKVVYFKLKGISNKCKNSREFNDFQTIFLKNEFSDVTFVVGETKFPAHKAILAARSPVFAAQFIKPMVNSKGEVHIKDIKPAEFKKLLEFIYLGKISDVNSGVVGDLFIVAEKYGVEGLKDLCEKLMIDDISVKNVIKYFRLSNLYKAERLKSKTLQYIKANVRDIIRDPESKISLRKLDPDLMYLILESVAQSFYTIKI